MPFPAIVPRAQCREEDAAAGMSEAEAEAGVGGGGGGGAVSAPHARRSPECRDDDVDDGGDPPSPMDAAVVVDNGDRLGRLCDSLDQWDALVEREGRDHYAAVALVPLSSPPPPPHGEEEYDDEREREGLCAWCYSVVDRYDVARDTVCTAMSYFDRLVASGVVMRGEWSLAVASSLFLAVKVGSLGGRVFFPEHMAGECRRFVPVIDAVRILDMEHHICHVLDWHLNPPGPCAFVDVVTDAIMTEDVWECYPDDEPLLAGHVVVDYGTRHLVVQQSKYLCELSVLHSYFVGKSPSSIACASIVAAVRLGGDAPPFAVMGRWFESLGLDRDPDETSACVGHLLRLIGCDDDPSEEVAAAASTVEEGSGKDAPKSRAARAVTPTKDDLPPPARVASSSTSDGGGGRPGAKKMRAESLFGEGGEGRGEGEEDVEMAESPKKKIRP